MTDSLNWQYRTMKSCVFKVEKILDPKLLGERIRQAREKRGLSQEEFAALISRDQRAVSEYEHGKRRISVTDLPTIAQALEVPLLFFYEGDLTTTDLDYALLKEFQRLPSTKAKRFAIDVLRQFNEINP